jgi:SAM-dependent methyltransferase
MMHGFWNRLKAEWYHKGLKYSTLPKVALPVITARAKGARTFLDIGAGPGTLAIPLAKAGLSVTALDASGAMIELLREEIKKKGLKRIRPVHSKWGDCSLKTHDAVLCSNVPALVKETPGFLVEAIALARKYVFIIEGADPGADKFYYKELYPLLFNKSFGPRSDYIKTYDRLHSMGIYANVEVIEYDFDQPFANLDEALLFWKEYMGVVTAEHDAKLRKFLAKKLVKKGKGLLAKFHKRSAIMWWKK